MAITGSPLDGPADCTLACDEGHLTAHKILLCAHSKYLLDILSNFPEAEHPIIILTEINIIDIQILVNYMYTGELTITNDCSPSNILRAAKILKIESLTDFEDEDEPIAEDLEDSDHHHHHINDTVTNSSNNNHHNTNSRSNSNNNNHHNHQNHHLQHNSNNNNIDSINNNNYNNNNNNNINSSNSINNNHTTSKTIKSKKSIYTNSENNFEVSPTSAVAAAAAAVATASKHQTRDGPNNKIRCHMCNIGLSDVKCLYRHVLTRHLSEKFGYKCEFCDREFSRDDHLMRHYTTKHKNMEFNREKIRETRRLNREMAKNYHDQISKFEGSL